MIKLTLLSFILFIYFHLNNYTFKTNCLLYLSTASDNTDRCFNLTLKSDYPDLFLLAMIESSLLSNGDTVPNYHAWNCFGFVGAWQINVLYMDYLGIPSFTLEEFILNPDSVFPKEVQLLAIKELIRKNRIYLEDYWHFIGTNVNDIDITETGIIYAAHLAGHRGVKRFFDYNFDPSDAFGTNLSDYMDYKNTFPYHIELLYN